MCKVIDVHVFGNKAESGGKVEKGRKRGAVKRKGEMKMMKNRIQSWTLRPTLMTSTTYRWIMYIDVCCVEIDRHLLGSSVACAMSCTQVTNRSPRSLHYWSTTILSCHSLVGWYNFRNGTERRNGTTASRSGFFKNMIIYGTEWRNALWLAGTEP